MLLVTGGTGFIGLNFVLSSIEGTGERPRESLASGLEKTVRWCLEHMEAHFAAERA